jgi:signal transduction histidine kinase
MSQMMKNRIPVTQVRKEKLAPHPPAAHRAAELALLNKAGQALTSTLDLPTILAQIMTEVNQLFQAEGASVLLHDPATDELVFAAVATAEARALLGTRFPATTGIAGWVLQHRQSILLTNAHQDRRFYDRIDAITGLTTRSLLVVPLINKQTAIGVVEVVNKAGGRFNRHDLEILEILAGSAAIALENARLFEQVRAGREQMRQLAQQILAAQEAERQRLSYELHDEAGQTLTALKMWLELIQASLPHQAELLPGRIAEAVALTDTTLARLRALAKDLRPPALDVAGLNGALGDLCADFARRTNLTITYTGLELTGLSNAAMICLYRCLQEALTNVAKHAQANQVWVRLQAGAGLVSLTVADNGQGFAQEVEQVIAAQVSGIGLLGLQERLKLLDGWLELESRPGQGATVTACLPLTEA